MLILTKEELKSHQGAEVCYICGKRFLNTFANDNNYQKVRDHVIIQVNIEVLYIVFGI